MLWSFICDPVLQVVLMNNVRYVSWLDNVVALSYLRSAANINVTNDLAATKFSNVLSNDRTLFWYHVTVNCIVCSSGTSEETKALITFRAANEQRFLKSKYAAKQLWEWVFFCLFVKWNRFVLEIVYILSSVILISLLRIHSVAGHSLLMWGWKGRWLANRPPRSGRIWRGNIR